MEESTSFLSNDEVESVRGKTGLNCRYHPHVRRFYIA
jgi:hypothetical protein